MVTATIAILSAAVAVLAVVSLLHTKRITELERRAYRVWDETWLEWARSGVIKGDPAYYYLRGPATRVEREYAYNVALQNLAERDRG
jgi:hypothetical protein